MNKNICFGCGHIFDEPYYIAYGDYVGVGGRPSDPKVPLCPNCGSDEWDVIDYKEEEDGD